MKKRYKITISYDGTPFAGWQIQNAADTIQERLENALEILLKEKTKVTGSGRTDAGVHAYAQTAHFDAAEKPSLRSLNALLPPTIRVHSLKEAPHDFHARFSSLGKVYLYRIHTSPTHNPFTKAYTTHFTGLDLEKIREAIPYFLGKKDFTSFANKGSSDASPLKHLRRIDIYEVGDEVQFEFEGDGFLYKMVRNIMGALLDISNGKLTLSDVEKIFDAKDRRELGAAAPAKGLFLKKVHYPQ